MLTDEEVLKIADLARIELQPEEVEKFKAGLSTVLDYVADLQKVDTEHLEIVSSVTGLENIQREDAPIVAENRGQILSGAPETKDGLYKVKSIL